MARPRSTASVRKLVSEAVSENYSKADITAIIEAAKGSLTSGIAECPECGHTMRAKLPDVKKQLETLISLLEQGEGKASQALPEATSVTIVRPAR